MAWNILSYFCTTDSHIKMSKTWFIWCQYCTIQQIPIIHVIFRLIKKLLKSILPCMNIEPSYRFKFIGYLMFLIQYNFKIQINKNSVIVIRSIVKTHYKLPEFYEMLNCIIYLYRMKHVQILYASYTYVVVLHWESWWGVKSTLPN